MEYVLTRRVTFAAPGLYSAPSPSVTLPGGGANVKITSTAHGLTSGNMVTVSGTTGVTGLNANWQVLVIDADHFDLVGSSALTGSPAGTCAVSLVNLDISGPDFTKEWYVRVKVFGTGVLALEDTVDAFTNTQPRFFINGKASDDGQEFLVSWRDWVGWNRFGVANAKMRLRLMTGTNVAVSVVVCTNG